VKPDDGQAETVAIEDMYWEDDTLILVARDGRRFALRDLYVKSVSYGELEHEAGDSIALVGNSRVWSS
jgi:hypothetical protein